MRRLSLTTWSLHPLLTAAERALRLVDVPARMRMAGIGTLEICHFHLPDTSPATLRDLRVALDGAGVELFSILIDMGDISSPGPARREADLAAITGWIDVAAQLGAPVARVVAGEAAPDDEPALERAIGALRDLARYGAQRGVRVLTENFKPLASTAGNCVRILDALDGSVGLCADIGNLPPERRLREFQILASRAESVHVKADYDARGELETAELRRFLDAARAAGFRGPMTLVYDREGDRWQGIAQLSEIVAPYTETA